MFRQVEPFFQLDAPVKSCTKFAQESTVGMVYNAVLPITLWDALFGRSPRNVGHLQRIPYSPALDVTSRRGF